MVDDGSVPLGGVERVHQPEAELLVVGQRREHAERRGLGAQHARGGGDVAAVDDGEVERHVMPGELPAPRRLSRRAEHLEAVPVRVEQAPQRLRGHRPEHVLHGYHRDDLRVRGHARAGHDQLVAELALPRVQRADRQPVPVPRGQVRPGTPLVAEPVAGLFPLFLGQRSEECRGGTRHPFGRRGRGQPVPVVHDPIIRLRPPARSCEQFAAARGWLMSMCCNGISGSCWEDERPRAPA